MKKLCAAVCVSFAMMTSTATGANADSVRQLGMVSSTVVGLSDAAGSTGSMDLPSYLRCQQLAAMGYRIACAQPASVGSHGSVDPVRQFLTLFP